MHAKSFCRAASARIVIILSAFVAGLFGFNASASAQGTMGMLPDPVTTSELMQYGDRLGLSDEQRRAAQTIHDSYLRNFRELREGEIADLMEQTRQLQRTMMGMPDRELLDEVFDKWHRARRQIRQLDERLFLQLQPMLTDSQLHRLPRVQLARERKRIGGMQPNMSMGGARVVDLSHIVMQLDLGPTELGNIDPILETYERRLTRDLKSLFDASIEMMTTMFDVMADLDFDEREMMNPARAQEFMEAVQQAMEEAETQVREATVELHEYNRRVSRQIAGLLPEDTARLVRHRFAREAFPSIADILRQTVERRFQAALLLEDLTDRQREQIEFALRDMRDKRDRLVNEFVQAEIDWIENRSMFSFDPDDWRTRQEAINEKQSKASELDQEALATLKSILGEQQQEVAESRLESIESTYRQHVFEERASAQPSGAEEDAEAQQAAARQSGPDQYLPPWITAADLTRYADMLGLAEDDRDVLRELHEVYQQSCETIESDVIKKIQEGNRSRWSRAQDEDASLESLRSEIVELFRLREQALARILEADRTFFNDIETVLLGEDDEASIRRVRNHRLRQVYGAGTRQNTFGGHQESAQDILELARRAGLHRADRDRLADALHDYEEQRIELLRSRHAKALEVGRESEIAQMEMMVRARRSDEDAAFDYQEMNERVREYQQPMRDYERQLTELNQDTLAALPSVVSEDGYRMLRETYYRRAFPSIYNDPTSIESHLDKAMNLPGLTESQRMELRNLAASYRPTYNELTESMVAIQRDDYGVVVGVGMPADWREAMHRREQIARIRFERNELNARAITTLRSMLRDEQIDAIGGLPDPEDAIAGGIGS